MSHHFIHFSDVHYSYPNGEQALRGIDFKINHGEKVAIVGNNGAGKSTLILHTNGLLLPTKGTVNIGNIPVSNRTLSQVRQSVGLVFQNPDDQLFMPTVYDDVAFGPINMNLPVEEVKNRVAEALKAVDATHLGSRVSHQLSGGQKRIIAIASVLAMEPNILVMDEPSANLDSKGRRKLINLLKTFFHTCLIATHDLELVWEVCPRTLVMKDGLIIADNDTKAIFTDTHLLEIAEIEQPFQAKFSL